jgi:hypothetical protein
MICSKGTTVKKNDGTVGFVCQAEVQKGKQCPYVKICPKTMKYIMVNEIDCESFIPKLERGA